MFLIIITRNGSLIPNDFAGSCGHVMYVVVTFVPRISRTKLWMSLSVILFMWPFLTFLSQIWSGFDPIEYKIDINPDWNVFLNILCFNLEFNAEFSSKSIRNFVNVCYLSDINYFSFCFKGVSMETIWHFVFVLSGKQCCA